MLRLKTIAALALTAGLSLAAPSFAKASPVRTETRKDVRVETRDVRGGHDDHIDRTRIQRDVRVERDVHVDRDIHIDRDRHDRDWHGDGIRIGIGPVFAPRPVYVPEPVYVPAPVYVEPNTDVTIGLNTVPACVLNTVSVQSPGAIETAHFVRQDGLDYYRFIVAGRTGHLDVHVAVDGRLLSETAC